MENPYQPVKTLIEDVVVETPLIRTFVLRPEEPIAFATGQFIEMTVPGLGEGPFTPSSSPAVSEKIDVTIMRAGKVTSRLHEMGKGESIGLRGPYGKGYPLDEFKGKEVFIVGGGVGLAPLRSLLYALFDSIDDYPKVYLRYGAKTPEDIIYKKLIQEWAEMEKVDVQLTVDEASNGWDGHVGVVTTILDEIPVDLKNTVAVVCGPPVMMRFTVFKLLEQGFAEKDIYLSMEKNMSCGIGKCGHCGLGKYYVCKDGPVFSFDSIKHLPDIWE